MATRGAKPKPIKLRLVDNTHNVTRHGSRKAAQKVTEEAQDKFGALRRPAGMKGEALAAWKRYIEPAAWLDGSREPAAIAFCELWAEFRFGPTSFPASKHGQLRAYMAELGLTDERNRGETGDEEEDEFFGKG